MLKAVIFDMDGVLSDSVGRDIAITVAAYKKFGYSITKSAQPLIIGRHPADRIAFFADQFDIPDEKQRLIVVEEKRLYRELWDTTSKLFPDVKETLDSFKKKGTMLALATTSTRDYVMRWIQKFHLEGYFNLNVLIFSDFALTRIYAARTYLSLTLLIFIICLC
ncbi:Phosphoglycolate phosphatase [ANME-1 cluster archaeon GoMg1]|nr:Phosphoglycolate phosphatase [ANME-1 cluster archaeon GoMg1]